MKKIAALLLVGLAGCEPDPEIQRLHIVVNQLRVENEELKKNLPSEQPKVAKELEEARANWRLVAAELKAARSALEMAKRDLSPELQPMSATLKDLRHRIEVLESTTSRRGHTHAYADGSGTIFSRTTDPDK